MKKIILILLGLLSLAQAKPPQKITIFTATVEGIGKWDPDRIRSGISGSEESVIYVSQELAKLGYEVIVLGNPPEGSPHSLPTANPRFIPFDPNQIPKSDIAISWRMPAIGEALRQYAPKVYLWPQDIQLDRLTKNQIQSFDYVLWISEWQRRQWISVNPGFSKFTKIFGNAIVPEQFQPVQKRDNPHACIYGSNYGRGLDVLLDIWPQIKAQFPKATLDIYYGWQHWGLLSKEKEEKMRKQMKELTSLDVRDHGLVGHEELNRAYEKASIWTYPCTDVETFCITAIRAQLAGAIPVVILNSALPETVRHGYNCTNKQEYFNTLVNALKKAETISVEERKKMGDFILKEFTWKEIALKWEKVFEGDIHVP